MSMVERRVRWIWPISDQVCVVFFFPFLAPFSSKFIGNFLRSFPTLRTPKLAYKFYFILFDSFSILQILRTWVVSPLLLVFVFFCFAFLADFFCFSCFCFSNSVLLLQQLRVVFTAVITTSFFPEAKERIELTSQVQANDWALFTRAKKLLRFSPEDKENIELFVARAKKGCLETTTPDCDLTCFELKLWEIVTKLIYVAEFGGTGFDPGRNSQRKEDFHCLFLYRNHQLLLLRWERKTVARTGQIRVRGLSFLLTVKDFSQIPQSEQTHLPKSSYKTLRQKKYCFAQWWNFV